MCQCNNKLMLYLEMGVPPRRRFSEKRVVLFIIRQSFSPFGPGYSLFCLFSGRTALVLCLIDLMLLFVARNEYSFI